MKHLSHLSTAAGILDSYDGSQPFGSFIKSFFRQHKKFGSRDRKQISHCCYCFFRLGKAVPKLPVEERILLGLFLCSSASNEILQALRQEWNERITAPLHEKINLLETPIDGLSIFPYASQLSEGIDHQVYGLSQLVQPDLFIRIRPKYEQTVRRKLEDAQVSFESISPACLALANGTKIEATLVLNKEAVIQDRSSQETGALLELFAKQFTRNKLPRVWDCCAASGGKSILAVDTVGRMMLTVSDLRQSILVNLRKRFEEAGIHDYKSFVADLSTTTAIQNESFDLVIADVPCTGSGTWARTPEQLYYFSEEKISQYAQLQKKIVEHILPSIAAQGYLLYITCSVFSEENENAVAFIQHSGFKLISMQQYAGYTHRADTLFAALLQKPS